MLRKPLLLFWIFFFAAAFTAFIYYTAIPTKLCPGESGDLFGEYGDVYRTRFGLYLCSWNSEASPDFGCRYELTGTGYFRWASIEPPECRAKLKPVAEFHPFLVYPLFINR